MRVCEDMNDGMYDGVCVTVSEEGGCRELRS